jgi:ABC-type sugar transport system ATPase subunit
MVFQNYALYPHLSVSENIIFGLKVRRLDRAERDRRLKHVAEMLDLEPYLDRKPAELSGGQRQRVALGRALVSQAKVILMDEPLSNLDAKLRQQMRVDLRALQRELGLTVVYVTHDQVEAMTMADRVVVMRDGHVEQVATPVELYQRPASAWVARFIGSPPMNLVPAARAGGSVTLEWSVPDAAGGGSGPEAPSFPAPAGAESSDAVLVGVRPEDVHLDGRGDVAVPGRVRSVEILGADTLVALDIGTSDPLVARVPGIAPMEVGEVVTASVAARNLTLFDRASGSRLDPPESQPGHPAQPSGPTSTERGHASHVPTSPATAG